MNNQNFQIKDFFKLETASGIILIIAAVFAVSLANSPLSHYYDLLIDVPVEIKIGAFEIAKPLLLWVNDGLMAVFFFLIGLELKREFLEGELSNKQNIILPAIGAVGGMVFPAAVYIFFNYDDPVAIQGWAIPAATDIAFSLAILSMLGTRIPLSLKVFLTSLAIFDDVGVIVIIALFYTNNISMLALIVAAVCMAVLFFVNRSGYAEKSIYIFIGIVMWVALLKSGVHATLTGILLALFIPMRSKADPKQFPLKSLEHDLHTVVAFVILPIFAFCNSGINLSNLSFSMIMDDISLGVALGLFLGKQLGVFVLCWLSIKLGFARLPKDISLMQLYGVAILTGIGFTMSLFIGSLAFEETGVNLMVDERLGIIIGSLASGIMGYLVLRFSSPEKIPQH